MTNRSIAHSRGDLLNSVATVRFALLPVLAGAALALAGNAFAPTQAFAADVVCAPVASSTVLTGDTTCTGAGDQILFLSQTAPAIVTVNGVTITGATAPFNAIAVGNGVNNVTINVTGGGSITATTVDTDAIFTIGTTGSSTISVGATPLASTGAGFANGIEVLTSTGAISITAAGTIIDGVALNAANTGTGIYTDSSTGSQTITTTGAGSIGNFAGTTLEDGILAQSVIAGSFGTGVITISNTSQIGNSAAAGNGVDRLGIIGWTGSSAATAVSITNTGAIFVDNAVSFGVTPFSVGISGENNAGTGAVTIVNSGAVGTADYGIYANGGGNVSISNSGAVAGDIGIRASTSGTTSTVTVLNTGGSVSGTSAGGISGDGILALGGTVTGGGGTIVTSTSTGLVTVGTSASRIAGTISGNGGATNNSAQGINARGLGDVSVYTAAGSTVSTTTNGSASWGIRATSEGTTGAGGAVTVDTLGTVTGTGTTTAGILANTSGTATTDTVTVNTAGAVTSTNGTAIDVRTVNGAANVTVTGAVSGGVGTGNDGGISAVSTGTGKVTVTTSGAGTVTAGGGLLGKGIGIITGTGGFALNVGANVSSTGSNAIQTIGTTGVNTIAITGGTVASSGAGATTASVNMTSSSGGLTTLNISAGATVTSSSATTALQNADVTIAGNGGAVIINNAGTVRGRTDFSGITANANGVTFNNAATGQWHVAGTTVFGSGTDYINNAGLLQTSGTTNINFGPTGLSFQTFSNLATGTFRIGEAAGASTTTIGGNAVAFGNAGAITLVDNETNDRLVGPSYTGSGSPTLAVDVNLGAGTQTGCAAAVVADCIQFLAFTGSPTTVTVNDIGGAGALNFTGITVVDGTLAGATANNQFVLGGTNTTQTTQGLAIQKGFVQYQLLPDTANTNFVLVGLPGAAMIELASLPGGLQNIWHDTSEGSAERLAALRQNFASANTGAPVPAQASSGFNVWGKVGYSDLVRDSQQAATILGAGFAFDTSYTQGTLGIQVGIDKVVSNANGGALVIGLLGGYNSSVLRFDADRTKATYRVFNIGGYASYMNAGGLSADLLVKDDIARIDLNVPGVAGLKDVDANSLGVKGTIGQRIGMDMGGVFFQPTGSIAYVRSTLKNIADPSAVFDFADANSMRGVVGLNVGADTTGVGGFTYRPLVFLGVGHEFEGKNRVDITSGTTTIDLKDQSMKTFGLFSLGLSVFNQGNMSGFVKGDKLFSKNTNAWQIQAGMRFTN